MVARIAPSPIVSNVATGDALAHAPASAAFAAANGALFSDRREQVETRQVSANTESNVPPPAASPGEAFAAAVIAGQLPPRPITPEQLRQRLGSAWQPPASPLRLMDRSA